MRELAIFCAKYGFIAGLSFVLLTFFNPMNGVIRLLASGGGSSAGAYSILCLDKERKVCEVQLGEHIRGPGAYKGLRAFFNTAQKGQTINLHLTGYGGNLSSAIQLYNAIEFSKANVIVHVESVVASAHATLAFAGNSMRVYPNSLFIFHRSSTFKEESKTCSKGWLTDKFLTDRGLNSKQKCVKLLTEMREWDKDFFLRATKGTLTQQQVKAVLRGEDIMVHGREIAEQISTK